MARHRGWKRVGALMLIAVVVAVTRHRAPRFFSCVRDGGGHPGSIDASVPRLSEPPPARSAVPPALRPPAQVTAAYTDPPRRRPPIMPAAPTMADLRPDHSPLRPVPDGRTPVADGEPPTEPRDTSASPADRGESKGSHAGGAPAPILIWDGRDPARLPPAPTSPIAAPLLPHGAEDTLRDRPFVAERQDDSPHLPALRLNLLPAREQLSPGDHLWVDVVLTGGREITSVPFHVRFDPEVLRFAGAMKGPAFPGGTVRPIILASVNPRRADDLVVGLSLIGSSGTFTGSGALIRLEFEALHPGRSELVLERSSVRGGTGETLPARIEGCSIQVVP